MAKINIRAKCKLFTLFLLLKWIPDILLNSITIFIPKKHSTNSPANPRPLYIAANLTRLFHKVIVNRISPRFVPDEYQFGFRPLDGVALAIDTLDAIMSTQMKDLKPFSIAVLDLEKAIDNVKHAYN